MDAKVRHSVQRAAALALKRVAWVPTARRHGEDFESVQRFCLFIGYPRSGHSLVGSLLNAHRHAVISHELDVLPLIEAGFSREAVYALVLRRDRWFERRDQRWDEFDYRVDGLSQGSYSALRVIGDKKGGRTTRRLADDLSLLDRLQETVDDEVCLVHVVRNPYDNIATMRRRGMGSEAQCAELYLRLAQTVDELRRRPPGRVLDVHLRDLIRAPSEELARVVTALGLDAEPTFLARCAEVVASDERQSRHELAWDRALHVRVARAIDKIDFLGGYELEA